MPKKYLIGTRGSLLAVTQCEQVKAELERLTGDEFELKTIKTEGDAKTSLPLWQMEGQNFFTKELDQALLSGEVDMVVHSYKDLGSIRPKGLKLCAVTKRDIPHDIFLIKKETLKNIDPGKTFIVGTSSPRRMTNVKKSLAEFLPGTDKPKVDTDVLRGNVGTRIQKLRDGNYDAIILAFAGLNRLAKDPKAREELKPLLEGLDFMIMPRSSFPSAASQGALAIEISESRDDYGELLEKLQTVHHLPTAESVGRERKAFNDYGGGCHLAVGINVTKVDDDFLHVHKGHHEGSDINIQTLENDRPKANYKRVFVGFPAGKMKPLSNPKVVEDHVITKVPQTASYDKPVHAFVTSRYCLDTLKNLNTQSVWTAGTKTMRVLANNGIWSHGAADGLGEEEIKKLFSTPLVELFLENTNDEFVTLTNDKSTSTLGKTLASYTRETAEFSEDFLNELKECDVFYWTSAFQYNYYLKYAPFIKDKTHCTGLGKTYRALKELGANPVAFASLTEFLSWADIKGEQ